MVDSNTKLYNVSLVTVPRDVKSGRNLTRAGCAIYVHFDAEIGVCFRRILAICYA